MVLQAIPQGGRRDRRGYADECDSTHHISTRVWRPHKARRTQAPNLRILQTRNARLDTGVTRRSNAVTRVPGRPGLYTSAGPGRRRSQDVDRGGIRTDRTGGRGRTWPIAIVNRGALSRLIRRKMQRFSCNTTFPRESGKTRRI